MGGGEDETPAEGGGARLRGRLHQGRQLSEIILAPNRSIPLNIDQNLSVRSKSIKILGGLYMGSPGESQRNVSGAG